MAPSLVAELHEDPRRRVVAAGVVARYLDEAGSLPGTHGAVVPGVGIDGHARPAALADEVSGHRSRGIRAEAATAGGRHEEHVEPFGVDLEIPDRLSHLLDDPGPDVGTREAFLHLGAREGLAVPVARDLRIGVPGDETVDVAGIRRPQRRQSSAYENSHSTTARVVAPALRYSAFAGTLSSSVRTKPIRMPRSRASSASRRSSAFPIPRRWCVSATSTS